MKHEEALVKIQKIDEDHPYPVSPKVNTKAYHDAFEKMPIPKPVAEAAYNQAGRILQQANGLENEYLVAINARTGELVTDNLDIKPLETGRTGFTFEQQKIINSVEDGVILLHNHPASTRPSLRDVQTAAEEKAVRGSIILAHDSDVWFVSVDNPKIADVAVDLYNKATIELGRKAKIAALDALLDLNKKHKLFIWKKVR